MAKKKKKKGIPQRARGTAKRAEKKDTRLDMLREQKILRAKQKVTGELEQRDAERLAWLDTELTKPPPLPADEKATARLPAFKAKAAKAEKDAEKEEPAEESPPAEEETLDEKAARKKRLAEARRKDQERKRQKELEQRVAEEERRRREAERVEEEEEPPPEEEDEPPPEEEEEPPPEEEEEPPPEEEEEPPPEEEEEPPPEEKDERIVAASDGWDDEDTDPGIALEADESSAREGDEEQAIVEPDLEAHGEVSAPEEPPPDEPAEMRAVESEDDVPDMSDDVPDMSDDVPDMSDDVPDMSDDEPSPTDDALEMSDDEVTPVPGEVDLAPPDEFDDLAGSGPAGIFMQPTAIKQPKEPAPDPPGSSVMVDPALFDDETKRGHPEAEVLAGLAKEEKTPVPGLGDEEKTPVPGLGPSDELAAAMAAAEVGVAEEEDPAVAESLARAEAFERAQSDKKKTLKMKARAKPQPEPEPEPEPESEDDLDVGAALEAGAQAGVDPGPSGGLSESALFTESVVIDMSDITGAKAISLGDEKSGQDLKQNDLTGPRQAVVKMTTGLSRSGTVNEPDLSADELTVAAPGGKSDKPTAIPIKKVLIIQLMLPSGLARPLPTGAQVKVVLKDGTRLTGFTPDRTADCKAFTLFPEKDRFIERVIVYTHAVKEVLTKD